MNEQAQHNVHPYYQAILDIYAETGRTTYDQLTATEAREQLRSSLAAAPSQPGLPELASINNECIAGPGGGIPVRRYLPKGEVNGVCVYMHSGGWVIGDLDTGDAFCRRLADGVGCEVISVHYRLAPEHPYPAALDDTYAVLEWAAANGSGPLLLAGESAGGNLAAAATLKAKQNGIQVAGQLLAYPVTDHDFSSDSYREVGSRNYLLSEGEMRWFWDQYCPPGVDRNDPLVSPLLSEDFAGLPPACVCVAELDPLRDEGLAYADRLAQAGVKVTTRCDEGMLHGYFAAAAAIPLAGEAVAEGIAWLKQCVAEAAG